MVDSVPAGPAGQLEEPVSADAGYTQAYFNTPTVPRQVTVATIAPLRLPCMSPTSGSGNTGPMAPRPAPTVVDFDEWLSNVHDVFMNTQLMRTLMDKEPVIHGGAEFMTSPRGRLERAAMRDLYVLIEAFKASPPAYLDELRRLAPAELKAVTSLLEDQDRVDALRQIRDYMSHRDVRRYFDIGRLAVVDVGPTWYRTVEGAFANLLLLALMSAHAERQAGSPTLTVDDGG